MLLSKTACDLINRKTTKQGKSNNTESVPSSSYEKPSTGALFHQNSLPLGSKAPL